MSATNSRLSLESYFLTELHYGIVDGLEMKPEASDKVVPIDLEVTDTTSLLNENERLWRCELTVKSAEPTSTNNEFYSFSITTVGFFKVDPEWPEEQMALLAETNCPAVLYSTSREIIATITRRSPFPPLLLPLVTFLKSPEPAKKVKKPSGTVKKKLPVKR